MSHNIAGSRKAALKHFIRLEVSSCFTKKCHYYYCHYCHHYYCFELWHNLSLSPKKHREIARSCPEHIILMSILSILLNSNDIQGILETGSWWFGLILSPSRATTLTETSLINLYIITWIDRGGLGLEVIYIFKR